MAKGDEGTWLRQSMSVRAQLSSRSACFLVSCVPRVENLGHLTPCKSPWWQNDSDWLFLSLAVGGFLDKSLSLLDLLFLLNYHCGRLIS